MTTPSSFDDQIVRKLAEILNETHLTEIEYAIGEVRVRVARQASVAANVQMPHLAPLSFSSPDAAFSTPLTEVTVGTPQKTLDWSHHPGVIKTPMVGTAYSAATPGAAPFVQVGSQVTKGQTLFIIEAMKVMNQIRSPKDGKVVEILFHDGEPVEYDHPMMVIE